MTIPTYTPMTYEQLREMVSALPERHADDDDSDSVCYAIANAIRHGTVLHCARWTQRDCDARITRLTFGRRGPVPGMTVCGWCSAHGAGTHDLYVREAYGLGTHTAAWLQRTYAHLRRSGLLCMLGFLDQHGAFRSRYAHEPPPKPGTPPLIVARRRSR
jgi:hypothetical protein